MTTSALCPSSFILTAKKRVSLALLAFLSLIAFPSITGRFASAQVLYGSVVGTVTDASGALIPDANVKLTNIDTNEVKQTTSTGAGTYSVGNLTAGTYTVIIAKPGFRSFSQQSIPVGFNSEVRVNATLQVGSQEQVVTVSAEGALLQTDRADVHTDISSREFESLPQPTRTYQGLVELAPGVDPPSASAGGTNNSGRSMQIESNGTAGSSTDVRIGGISAVTPWVQFFSSAVPSTEAIQTVNVVTGTPEAEQGLASGTQINVEIKGGSNQFHGSAYWYHENRALEAKPFFLPPGNAVPNFIDNDWGLTLGGPIKRNKLFFFGSYEGDFLIQGVTQFATVPTDAVRAGNFSQLSTKIFDPTTGNANGTGKQQFYNNVIPASQLSPIVAKLIPLIPHPNVATSSLSNNYFVNTPQNYRLQKIDTRTDWNATSKLTVSGRVSLYPYNDTQNTVFGDALGGANNRFQNGDTYAISASGTYVVTPHFLIDAEFGFTRAVQYLEPPEINTKAGANLGIPGVNLGTLPVAGGLPQFLVSNYSNYGYAVPYLYYNDPVFQYSANATWTKGSHNVQFGMTLLKEDMNHVDSAGTAFTFTGGVTALNGGASPDQYNSFADFLLGLPTSIRNGQALGPITERTWEYNLYVRDQWQVNKRLTVSLGTGWDYFPIPTRANGGLQRYDFSTNTYLNCGRGGTPLDCGTSVQKDLFAPKVGIAFRPTESFVIRAGYGLSYEQINTGRDILENYPEQLLYNASSVNPFVTVAPLSQGVPPLAVPNVSAGTLPLPVGVTFATLPKNFTHGYIESFNLTLEKNFGRGWFAQAGYVGTHTVHQYTRWNFNYGQVGGGVASEYLYKLDGISAAETEVLPLEAMHYNSLQTTLQHRFANGFQTNIAYTYSKWMGLCCDANGDGAPAISIPQYYNLNRSLMPGDLTHNLVISGMGELPFGHGRRFLQNGIAASVLGGFQLTGIFNAHSGYPFSISADGTSLNAPGSTQRADQVKSAVTSYGGIGSNPYFDPYAFQPVPSNAVRFGTAGFDSVRGPGAANLDLGLFRNFRLGERYSLQFRAEALNATNTPHFRNPGGNVSLVQYAKNADGSPNYSQILNLNGYDQIIATNPGSRLTDQRYFRLGLKLSF